MIEFSFIEFFFWASDQIVGFLEQSFVAGEFSLLAVSVILLGGIVTGISPVGITAAMAIAGQATNNVTTRHTGSFGLSLAFVLGGTVALVVAGFLAALIGDVFISFGLVQYIPWLTLVLGLQLLGVFQIVRVPGLDRFQSEIDASIGPKGAFAVGVPFGVMSSPCTAPIVLTLLAFVGVQGNLVYGTGALLIFAVGRGIPILLIGLTSEKVSGQARVMRWRQPLQKVMGVLIVLASIYFLTFGSELLGSGVPEHVGDSFAVPDASGG